MNELALFAGAGGGILGGHLLGWRTVCAVEWEPYAACVLAARQNDGILPPFPIWDDVQTFDGKPWAGRVDVISGGFPCQDISAAGRGAGIKGTRSGMWGNMARIIGEVLPRYVYVENSPMLVIRGLGTVLGDLAALGFNARWGVISAADVGAPHQRDRIWIVGDSIRKRRSERWDDHGQDDGSKPDSDGQHASQMADASSKGRKANQHIGNIDGREVCGSVGEQGKDGGNQSLDNSLFSGLERKNDQQESPRRIQQESGQRCNQVSNATSLGLSGQRQYEQSVNSAQSRKRQAIELVYGRSPDFWAVEPNVGRVVDGVAARVDRLKAIGNGQVPLVAATAWRLLNDPS